MPFSIEDPITSHSRIIGKKKRLLEARIGRIVGSDTNCNGLSYMKGNSGEV
jgi:hypothetical protein